MCPPGSVSWINQMTCHHNLSWFLRLREGDNVRFKHRSFSNGHGDCSLNGDFSFRPSKRVSHNHFTLRGVGLEVPGLAPMSGSDSKTQGEACFWFRSDPIGGGRHRRTAGAVSARLCGPVKPPKHPRLGPLRCGRLEFRTFIFGVVAIRLTAVPFGGLWNETRRDPMPASWGLTDCVGVAKKCIYLQPLS